jgi:hypothetical protein
VAVVAGLFLAAVGGPAGAAEKRLTETLTARGGGWDLIHPFANTAPIPIVDNGPATLYPSNVVVSGRVGTVNDAAVVLRGFTHTFPDDVDMMLVSPSGTRVMLQSDAGGAANVSLDYGISNAQTFDGTHTGDYNGDGRVDIVWRHQGTGENLIWYMGGPYGTTLLSGVLMDPPVVADTQWKIVGPRWSARQTPLAPAPSTPAGPPAPPSGT